MGWGTPDDILVYSAQPASLWADEQYQFVVPNQRNTFSSLAWWGLTQRRLLVHLLPAFPMVNESLPCSLQYGHHCCFPLLLYLANEGICCPFCAQGRGLSANCPEAPGAHPALSFSLPRLDILPPTTLLMKHTPNHNLFRGCGTWPSSI